MDILEGKVTDVRQAPCGCELTIKVTCPDTYHVLKQEVERANIQLLDGRAISADQRKKTYALINEISEWVGDIPEFMKKTLKMDFVVNRMSGMAKSMFSLSNCSMTLAREFITYLIDFVIEHGVPLKNCKPYEMCEDIQRYMYSCICYKRCAVCGKKADIHHVDRVGMGRNRKEIVHEGMEMMALCRTHHTECHTMPQSEFNEMYHLEPVVATKELCKKLGLKTEVD